MFRRTMPSTHTEAVLCWLRKKPGAHCLTDEPRRTRAGPLTQSLAQSERCNQIRRPGREPPPASERRRNASVAGGTAGFAVLYGYLSRAAAGRRYKPTALHFLEHAGHTVASVAMDPSLYGGFTGVAWTMAHLNRTLFKFDEDDATEAVDEALKNHVNRPGWRGEYDLVSGLAGFGVYALERLPLPAAVSCLEGIVDRLEETSVRRSGGIAWHTPPRLLPPHQRRQCPRGYYNLGLAHGVPGVIALLGAACAAGVRRRKARTLLDGAVNWLLDQKRQARKGSRFPAWIVTGVEPASCRSAWCYGDPGVAAALLCAARSVNESSWERQALEIARAAARRPPEEAGVVDAGLCHGAAGLGHVFNRMYQATGDVALRRAARFWFARTLAMRQPGRGVAGFSALDVKPDGSRYWSDNPRMLTGAAGIALALLAAITSIEPDWDRMLLVSTPRIR
jgi:lantibiotic modifying enzyme